MNYIKLNKIFFCFIILLNSCDIADHKLKIINNSKKLILPLLKINNVLKLEDTSMVFNIPKDILIKLDTLSPPFGFKNHGGAIYKINHECQDSTLFVYLFELELIKKLGWDSIVKNNIFTKKGYTVAELNSINWIIYINQ